MTTSIERLDELNQAKRKELQAMPGGGGHGGFGGYDGGYHSGPNWQFAPQPAPLLLEDGTALDLNKILGALWHFRGIFMTIALLLATALVVGNHIIFPDKYEATARVRVKMIGIDDDASIARNFSIISSEVLSDRVLTKVINDLGMTKRQSDPIVSMLLKKAGLTPKETIEDGSGIIRWLRQDISIGQERQGAATAVFTVSLTGKNPDAAAEIVNAIVTAYMDLRHTFESGDAAEAVAFLQPKVDAAQAVVNKAHEDLTRFQLDNTAYLVPAEDIEQNISRLQLEFTESANRIEQLAELNIGLNKLLKGEPRYVQSGAVIMDAPSAANAALAGLQQRYATAKARYQVGHPYLAQLQRDINALRAEASKTPTTRRSNGRVSNPEWLRLSQEITANEAEHTVLKRRLPSIRENIMQLTEHLSRAKGAQAALLSHQTRWDRAYTNLDILSRQLLDAQTQADAQTNEVGKDLEVLDPAAVPTLPVSASRTKLMFIGLIGSMVVAFLVVLVYSRIKNWQIPQPEEGAKPIGVIRSVFLNLIGVTWLLALVGYIIINPYI